MRSRSGRDAVSQSLNLLEQKQQQTLNYGNFYLDANMERVSVTTVQQINDRTYYRRGNRWVDSRLVKEEAQIKPQRVITFGSEEFIELARKLAVENRQGSIALQGDVLLMVDDEPVLVQNVN
jgi:hypothetical protein